MSETSHCKGMCSQKKESFAAFFEPLQHGVAVEGASERLVHHVNLLVESHPDWVLIKSDIKNAFNSVERSSMLPQVAESFPDLYPHVFQMYSGFSPLLFQKGEESYLLSSQEGVHQGDPLGPILFSLTIHPLLVDLQKSHPLIHTLAYLDDVFLVDPLDGVLSAFNDLRGSTSQVGLSIATNKCEIFGTGKSEYKSSEPICISFVGTTVLGTPVGRPDYIESYCSDTTLGGQTLCTQILAMNNPQCGMLLLRSCHVPRLNYLMRTVAPSLIMSATTVHDNLTRSTFQQLIKCPELNDDQWLQATLPTRFGGFGMLSAQSTSSIAFVSSWAGSLATLPQCFNDLQSLTVNVMNSTKDAAAGSIGHELQLSLTVNKTWSGILKRCSTSYVKTFLRLLFHPFRKIQTLLVRLPVLDLFRAKVLEPGYSPYLLRQSLRLNMVTFVLHRD